MILPILFGLSGFAGLVYEVLWLRELRLVFGSTAYATTATLAAFFLGMACGGRFWGTRAERTSNPLRLFALLETGVLVSAALGLLLMRSYRPYCGALFSALGTTGGLVAASKFVLSACALFLPAFFMGGALPAMGRHAVRSADRLGSTGSVFYGVNITGAAAGAFVTGFFLLRFLGAMTTGLLAMAITASVAVTAFALSQRTRERSVPQAEESPRRQAPGHARPGPSPRRTAAVAFASGLLVLSLEVLWVRMFAQALSNSVYAFSLITSLVLLALGVGAFVARFLSGRSRDPGLTLSCLLCAAGLAVFLAIPLFPVLSGGSDNAALCRGWVGFVATVLRAGALPVFVPGVLCGTVWPFLLKVSEPRADGVGRTIGRLVSMNTCGAIAGAILAGFGLLPLLGLWSSLRIVAAAYVLLAVWTGRGAWRRIACILALGGAGVLLSFAAGVRPRPARDSDEHDRSVVRQWDGSQATVAVIRRGDHTAIEVNGRYIMGGTASAAYEQRQAHLPLMLHPAPRDVYFLGMGTGITAGASLFHPVKRVVVTEIVPEIVLAARLYFRDHVNGLFDDDRATVVVCDGRNYLLCTPGRAYDVIIGDLFFPEKAGDLFTREHFRTVRSRLKPGGLFAQWIPLYQLSEREFGIIAATMLDVFGQVTLWRGDFSPSSPAVVLIGQERGTVLEADAVKHNVSRLLGSAPPQDAAAVPYIYYCGNISAARALFRDCPVSTDDRPLIEYLAPESVIRKTGSGITWLAGRALATFYETLLDSVPPERDPYLAQALPAASCAVPAGLHFYKSHAHREAGRQEEARREHVKYLESLAPLGSP